MSFKLILLSGLMGLAVIGCKPGKNGKKSDFSLKTTAKNDVFFIGEPVGFELVNKKSLNVESVEFSLGDYPVQNGKELKNVRLGKQRLIAVVHSDGISDTISKTITILNDTSPEILNFRILNTYPHDITSYTQGLEFHEGFLYESTGQYGSSKLRKINYQTGEVLKEVALNKSYFAEGLSIYDEKVFQLTWRNKTGFIYDLESLERIGSFKYGESKEGWGLCHDNTVLYKSDGTEKIWLLDPESLKETGYIQAYTNKGKIVGLNELEWVDGKIFANRYQKNGVAIINPLSGAIEGVIDFSPLKEMVTQHSKLDVLNGIAYNPETGTIFVTGKNWDKLFEIELTRE